MGTLGKTIGIGIGVLFVGTAALEGIGRSLKHDSTESEAAAAASESAQIASEAAADAAKATAEASHVTGAEPRSASKSEKHSASQQGPIKLAKLNAAEQQLRLLINLSGNLCAKPVEVRSVGGDLYGVSCITNRDGSGQSNYLVNSQTNEVTEI